MTNSNQPDLRRSTSLIDHGTRSKQFQEMGLPSFCPSFLFLLRVLLDVMYECFRLRLEQRPAGEPSALSVRQVSFGWLVGFYGISTFEVSFVHWIKYVNKYMILVYKKCAKKISTHLTDFLYIYTFALIWLFINLMLDFFIFFLYSIIHKYTPPINI